MGQTYDEVEKILLASKGDPSLEVGEALEAIANFAFEEEWSINDFTLYASRAYEAAVARQASRQTRVFGPEMETGSQHWNELRKSALRAKAAWDEARPSRFPKDVSVPMESDRGGEGVFERKTPSEPARVIITVRPPAKEPDK